MQYLYALRWTCAHLSLRSIVTRGIEYAEKQRAEMRCTRKWYTRRAQCEYDWIVRLLEMTSCPKFLHYKPKSEGAEDEAREEAEADVETESRVDWDRKREWREWIDRVRASRDRHVLCKPGRLNNTVVAALAVNMRANSTCTLMVYNTGHILIYPYKLL